MGPIIMSPSASDTGFRHVCDALKEVIADATGFDDNQVTIADEKIVAMGLSPVAVIQQQPRMEHNWETFERGHLHVWNIPVTVAALWKDATNGATDLAEAWQAVLDQICKYPRLNAANAVRSAEVVSADLEPVFIEVGNAKFASVALTVRVTEDVEIAEME